MDSILIYHGSEKVVIPQFGEGKVHNDYGQGFYCTEHIEMAKEWACAGNKEGYVNQYSLDTDGLDILNLNADGLNILNWLAILLENRRFAIAGGLPVAARNYILENFLPDYKDFDIIRGYRADDSYFAYATDFVNNTLSLRKLKKAMMLGALGEQIVLKSREAFDRVTPLLATPVERSIYYSKYAKRDSQARADYRLLASEPLEADDIFILDIIREGIKDGDARL